MLFSSITFLYYFLPAALIAYFLAPKKLKNTALLLSSLIFYAWGEPKYILLMAASILLGYIWGLLIEASAGTRRAKLFAALSAVTGLGLLGYFKYADFFIENFNAVTGLGTPLLKIALPIGISFYTFQILSYTIDVYRGNAAAQKNIINFAAYVALFPQLIAGPIVRYIDIADQLQSRAITLEGLAYGARRFILGLAKKVLMANVLGELCDIFRSSGEKSVLFYWMYAMAFTLHIYFDFSGYSDMAIGLGRIFGFRFLENFNYPYVSKSITEFWRRWHISLGTWFRDYVYIPMGGNRAPTGRRLFNLTLVWMLTGLWHGAAWNFVMWGMLFAALLIIEKLWLGGALKKLPGALSNVYVMFFVTVSLVLFNAESVGQAFDDVSGMFGVLSVPLITSETLYYLRSYAVPLIAGAAGCTPLCKSACSALNKSAAGKKLLRIAEPAVLACMLLLSTAYLVDGSYNPFLYFRF